METQQIRELNPDEGKILFMLTYMKDSSNIDELYNHLSNLAGGWVIKAIEKRFEAYKITIDKSIAIAILTFGDGAVGKAAKYVDDIAQWCHKNHRTTINFNAFMQDIYPNGIPAF